jgi:hypothetical protein
MLEETAYQLSQLKGNGNLSGNHMTFHQGSRHGSFIASRPFDSDRDDIGAIDWTKSSVADDQFSVRENFETTNLNLNILNLWIQKLTELTPQSISDRLDYTEQIEQAKHQTANQLTDGIEGLHTGMNDHKYVYGIEEIDQVMPDRPTLVIGDLILDSIQKVLMKDFQEQHFIAIRVLHPLDQGIPEDFYLPVHTGRNDIPTVYNEKTRQDFNDLLQEEDNQRIRVFKKVFPVSEVINCLTDDPDFKNLDPELASTVKVIFDK